MHPLVRESESTGPSGRLADGELDGSGSSGGVAIGESDSDGGAAVGLVTGVATGAQAVAVRDSRTNMANKRPDRDLIIIGTSTRDIIYELIKVRKWRGRRHNLKVDKECQRIVDEQVDDESGPEGFTTVGDIAEVDSHKNGAHGLHLGLVYMQ